MNNSQKKPENKSISQALTYTERRREVARLYIEGVRQADLAERFGVNQSTISRDLEAIRQMWVDEAIDDFNQQKQIELQRIDNLEREYWSQYEASKGKRSKTTKRISDKGGGKTYDVTEHEQEHLGDPRYLDGVQWCITQRCKIFGIYAAAKHQMLNIDMSNLSDNQLEDLASGNDITSVLASG